MKNITNKYLKIVLFVPFLLLTQACNEEVLTEKPLSFLSPDITLTSNVGFQSAIVGLHQGFREVFSQDNANADGWWSLHFGTDLGTIGTRDAHLRDYATQLTPTFFGVTWFWNWGYLTMLPRANQIIEYAEKPTAVWANDAQKNAVIAEARFFRAYTLNLLSNLYGDVPIADKVYTEPKVDFGRAPRKDVLNFIKADLEFASQHLPLSTTIQGRITKDCADHLLAEVYISTGEYDKAIAAATSVIASGRNRLMTDRFGAFRTQPGDVYSDMFKEGNINRSSGNLESLWVVQYEFQTPGGVASTGVGKPWLRCWGPRYFDARDPDNALGGTVVDSLGRGVSWLRPNNHVLHNVWREDPSDMRNSTHNIRRTWYYTNPSSKYFRQPIRPHQYLDTLYHVYPGFRKVEGLDPARGGRTFSDWPMMRLAETYLLRAEAHLLKGDKVSAAADINAVRARAKAKLATPAQIDLDYILDERIRELIVEEPRRLTLNRMGKLVERTKRYNGFALTVNTIKETNALFPIPQTFIDANFGNKIPQNPGY